MNRVAVLVIVVAALVACPNFDQLEADALNAGARLRDGGSMVGGGTAGGASGGGGGGVASSLTLTPVLTRPSTIVKLASTEGRLFIGMASSAGVTIDALLPAQGGVLSKSFTHTELDDLDARHGEAVACSGVEVAVFSGNAWQQVDAGISLGRCLSTTLYRNGGPTQIPVWWNLNDGGLAVLPVSTDRMTVEPAVPIAAAFGRLSVRPFGAAGSFYSGTDTATRVGTVSTALMLSPRQNPPLAPPRLAASQAQRLIAAVGVSGQAGLVVWEPTSQGQDAVEAATVRISNMGGSGISVHALARADDGLALVAEAMGAANMSLPFNWNVDGGVGSFSATGPFLVHVSAGQLRVQSLEGRDPPFALAFDETEKKLYLAFGRDGGSQVVTVAP